MEEGESISFQYHDDDDNPVAASSPSTSFTPAFELPQVPKPTLSRSTSTTHFRSQTSGRTSLGLDMSQPRYQTTSPQSESKPWSADDPDLEAEVLRARQARMARAGSRSQTVDMSSISSPPSAGNDPRDSATARDNIISLAGRGTASSSAGGGASLASFMGGGARPPPLHKVNTKMTEDEEEVTARLEAEMAASKSRWGSKAHDSDEQTPKTGMSLADLMAKGRSNTSAPPATERKAEEPTKAASAPAPSLTPLDDASSPKPTSSFVSRPAFTASPATSFTSSSPKPTSSSNVAKPVSLAAMMGSKTSGPRLNQPASHHSGEDGPAHASSRPTGGFAMPGMVRQRTKSYSSEAKSFVEPSIINRDPPKSDAPASIDAQIFQRAPPLSSSPPSARTYDDPVPSAAPIPRSPKKTDLAELSAVKMTPTASLTRLQSSNIVADRLKWSEQRQGSLNAPSSSLTPSSQTPMRSPEKKKSLMDRWGRDEPNVTGTVTSPVRRMTSNSDLKSEDVPKRLFTSQPQSAEPQKLVHLQRAQPPRVASHASKLDSATSVSSEPDSTPAPSPQPSPSASLIPEPVSDAIRSDPSPRFDSPAFDTGTWSEVGMSRDPSNQRNASSSSASPTKGWSGPPIGVREPNRSAAVTREEAYEPKYVRGVALPGMSAAPASSSIPSEARRIPPASERQRPQSISVSRTAKVDSEAPRSPGGGLIRDRIANWGQQQASASQPRSRTTSIDATPRGDIKRLSFTSSSAPAPSASTSSSPSPAGGTIKVGSGKVYRPASGEVARFLRTPSSSILRPSGSTTISTEVTSLSLASPLPSAEKAIFYETESLAIVHRYQNVGLAATTLFVWKGKFAVWDGAARREVEVLVKKLGVDPIVVEQGRETPELLLAFGEVLTIRKGGRESYEPEQTRLYRLEATAGSFVAHELSTMAGSLCSGFVHVVATVGDVYLWMGRGALDSEMQVSKIYAAQLADGRSVTTVKEQDEPAHFFHAIGGETAYSSAHYWRFRPIIAKKHELLILAIDTSSSTPISSSSSSTLSTTSISLVDAGYEQLVVVPTSCRSNKEDVTAALDAAQELSSLWKSRGLPFRPPVHVLAFPTVLPRDLAPLSRALDWSSLNGVEVATKMRVFTAEEVRSGAEAL